jgi:hypothetical protein
MPWKQIHEMSNTPETDQAILDSNGQWSFRLAEVSRMMEHQRNELIKLAKACLKENAHLADGNQCTLFNLKDGLKKILNNTK